MKDQAPTGRVSERSVDGASPEFLFEPTPAQVNDAMRWAIYHAILQSSILCRTFAGSA